MVDADDNIITFNSEGVSIEHPNGRTTSYSYQDVENMKAIFVREDQDAANKLIGINTWLLNIELERG